MMANAPAGEIPDLNLALDSNPADPLPADLAPAVDAPPPDHVRLVSDPQARETIGELFAINQAFADAIAAFDAIAYRPALPARVHAGATLNNRQFAATYRAALAAHNPPARVYAGATPNNGQFDAAYLAALAAVAAPALPARVHAAATPFAATYRAALAAHDPPARVYDGATPNNGQFDAYLAAPALPARVHAGATLNIRQFDAAYAAYLAALAAHDPPALPARVHAGATPNNGQFAAALAADDPPALPDRADRVHAAYPAAANAPTLPGPAILSGATAIYQAWGQQETERLIQLGTEQAKPNWDYIAGQFVNRSVKACKAKFKKEITRRGLD